MNDTRVVESVTNECQSLGRAHESSSARAEQLIACLEGEIAKRDEELAACRVAVENCEVFRARIAELEARIVWLECEAQVNAAPVSEAKAQGEYGDAYQGAREDLAIWKRRALEAEEKVLQQEQIIDHLTSEAQGESRFGEPVVTPDAPCVPDGYVLADKKALGTVLQALVNAPHHIRELQVTRQPVELFSDNPINVLIANYEAPAAPAAPAADAGASLIEWTKDAAQWGGALNYAAWEFVNECPEKSALLFNNTKGPLRAAIMKYAEIVAAHCAKGVV